MQILSNSIEKGHVVFTPFNKHQRRDDNTGEVDYLGILNFAN